MTAFKTPVFIDSIPIDTLPRMLDIFSFDSKKTLHFF